MYLIYNETGRALKLTTTCEDGNTTEFKMSIADVDGNFNEFSTITTITDAGLANIITGFCEKCSDIVNKTSRFFFRHPEKKVVSYNTETCEVVTYDKIAVEQCAVDAEKAVLKNPRNCIITVLNKSSKMLAYHSVMIGRIPAKVIHVGEYKILIMFARANNWSMSKTPNYIYIDGCDGKKQVRMGFVKTGPNKEYTTNNLIEEDFEGDEFPAEPPRKNNGAKKPYNNDRSKYNKDDRPNYNNRGNYNQFMDKDHDYDNDSNNRGTSKRGNPRRNKKNRHHGDDKFGRYN